MISVRSHLRKTKTGRTRVRSYLRRKVPEDYYKLPAKERLKIRNEVSKSKEKETERYYLWQWCVPYGWRQFGSMEGYKSLKELKKDCTYFFEDIENPIRVTTSKIFATYPAVVVGRF